MRKYSLLAIAVLIVTMISTKEASAQLINQFDFTVPFEFYAGNAKLPAGKYVLTRSDDDEPVWELRSSDGKVSVLIEVHDVQAPTGPSKSAVVFKKYEGRSFLHQVFEAGNSTGVELNTGRPEQRTAKTGATPSKHTVDATEAVKQRRRLLKFETPLDRKVNIAMWCPLMMAVFYQEVSIAWSL